MQVLSFEDCLDKITTPLKLPKKEYLKDGTYPVVAQENALINGYTNNKNMVFKVDSPLIIFGDHTRKLKYIDFDFVLGADGAKLIKPKATIDIKFFFYYLTLLMPKSIGYARHYRLLKELKFCIPLLAEQKRIVAKLDKAFAEIDSAIIATEHKQKEIEKLKQSLLKNEISSDNHLENIKTWDRVKLGDVCQILNGGTPNSSVDSYWNGNIFWLTPKDMGKLTSKYVDDTERKISELGLSNSSAKLTPQNSVILSCRAPIGHLAINCKDMAFNQGCKSLVPNRNLNFIYLYYFLLLSKEYLNKIGSGTTFKELSSKKLSKVSISLPPLAEQKRIVTKLDEIFKQADIIIANTQKQLNEYQSLKASLLASELQSEAA